MLRLLRMQKGLIFLVNEVLDVLTDFGIESSIRYDDYLAGFENLKNYKLKSKKS